MTSRRPRVLLTAPLPPAARAAAEAAFELTDLSAAEDPAADLACGAGIAALLTAPSRGADAALIGALPDLRCIALTGAGTDLVDPVSTEARGITLHPTGALLAEDVADTALLLMMAAIRNLIVADRHVRSGDWARGRLPLTRTAHGRRVGILGYGAIGQALARRLAGLDCPVRYCSRRPVDGHEAAHEPDLTVLARWADVLVLAVPGGPATDGIVDADVIAALGSEGTLINVARGSIVDEPALITALAEGRLGGAGLDVFATEPSPDPRFSSLDNVVLMPHCGSASIDAREAAAGAAVNLLIDLLSAEGDSLPVARPRGRTTRSGP